ncbi:hypothetical protein [Dokdonia sp. Asnod3-C12]|uniref:hypothetical protein n=1 Tax=Dokdonia sp. Asnod3-C12 TaxID=3160575 RepID=UPI003868A071
MNQISTKNIHLLPDPSALKEICKSLAALEAIICPEWEYRYYSYQKDWSATEEFCEMRNGQGDHMLIVFSEHETCINGFDHESELNGWKEIEVKETKSLFSKLFGSKKEIKTPLTQEIALGILDNLPPAFNEFIYGEPVKSIGTTFCVWQTKTDDSWNMGKAIHLDDDYEDGSSNLFHLLDRNPMTFKNWAEEYYEEEFEHRKLDIALIEKIYSGSTITKELVLKINPNYQDFPKLKSELDEIGYSNEL